MYRIVMKLKLKDYMFVGVQGVLFLVYLLIPNVIPFTTGVSLAFFGICLVSIGVVILIIAMLQLHSSISPFPTPKSNATLIQNGIFAYIRHPIYTGILLSTFGYGLFVGSLFKILVMLALYILFHFKSVYEEKRLRLMFDQYAYYQKKTGRFFPRIRLR
ncbi:isoprenylcysteine carboxylmethyltransferase family protein [Aquimarina sp. AD10]|nr:isoprenylcysteine carboxylmethyltransferase family protein [Aquimarina sp. AD10]RKN00425.1 DUF1295 domain-containing protein [Aquimarina sp. AD10]